MDFPNVPHLITFQGSNRALDVSGRDNRSCVIFQRHGAVNQQWWISRATEHGYHIQGACGYIGFEGLGGLNTEIECTPENRRVWRIVPAPGQGSHPKYYSIWHETLPMVLGVDNQLVSLQEYDTRNQVWQIEQMRSGGD